LIRGEGKAAVFCVHAHRPPKLIVHDMESSESPTYGNQEGSADSGNRVEPAGAGLSALGPAVAFLHPMGLWQGLGRANWLSDSRRPGLGSHVLR